jgi:dihydropteroate synthase
MKTQIFGILNATPDSFSDGGQNTDMSSALKSAEKMIENGAYAIDIGAESTRPNARTITFAEEIERLSQILPLIIKLGAKVSLDTRNFETAKWGLNQGVSIINDVSGFSDKRMINLVKEFNVDAVFMHSLTVPASPQIIMKTETMLEEIYTFAKNKILEFEIAGVSKEKLIFDSGIGFGKDGGQSLMLLQKTEFFNNLGVKTLIGHSRKSFLKTAFKERFFGGEVSNFEKDLMTSIFSGFLLGKVDFLRLHNTEMLKELML